MQKILLNTPELQVSPLTHITKLDGVFQLAESLLLQKWSTMPIEKALTTQLHIRTQPVGESKPSTPCQKASTLELGNLPGHLKSILSPLLKVSVIEAAHQALVFHYRQVIPSNQRATLVLMYPLAM